jgi:hypothetical protein
MKKKKLITPTLLRNGQQTRDVFSTHPCALSSNTMGHQSLLFLSISGKDKLLRLKSKTYFNYRISISLKCEPISNMSRLRQERKLARSKKTNKMLISGSLVFFVSWAPLNVLNVFLELYRPFQVNKFILNMQLWTAIPFIVYELCGT